MNLNRVQLKLVCQALQLAADYEESFVESYKIEWVGQGSTAYKTVPKEYRPMIRRTQTCITRFNTLRQTILEILRTTK